MTLDGYKVVLYRSQPSGRVAEVPAIERYALMPTREAALAVGKRSGHCPTAVAEFDRYPLKPPGSEGKFSLLPRRCKLSRD